MRIRKRIGFVAVALCLLIGCIGPAAGEPIEPSEAPGQPESDLAKIKAADFSILFIGNSHTSLHNVPDLVAKLIRFQQPEKKVHTHTITVPFLENAAHDPRCRKEIETRPWKYVVLQAQKISASGRFQYSRKEGIELAKQAKARGATVYFFSEWGLAHVPGDGARQEKIYQEMAEAAKVQVIAIGRAWDLALAQRPDLQLYEVDGNHESRLGAFLTACVITGRLTGKSPALLEAYRYPNAPEKDLKFLAEMAAKSLEKEPAPEDRP